MAYTVINFRTKKALKEAVAQYKDKKLVMGTEFVSDENDPVRCYNPGLGPDLSNFTGKVCLEGPHFPEAHKWYAEAELVDGIVVKVS